MVTAGTCSTSGDTCYIGEQCPPSEFCDGGNAGTCTVDNGASECEEFFEDQSLECLANCEPITPNGCDCFGCCDIISETACTNISDCGTSCTADNDCDPYYECGEVACGTDSDCPTGGSCQGSPVAGACEVTTGTSCFIDEHCPDDESCIGATTGTCDVGMCTDSGTCDTFRGVCRHMVYLGSAVGTSANDQWTCSYDVIDDSSLCRPCNQVEGCMNPCGDCELCFGQTQLPPGCGEPQCPPGIDSCQDNTDCEANEFCLTGCCYPIPV